MIHTPGGVLWTTLRPVADHHGEQLLGGRCDVGTPPVQDGTRSYCDPVRLTPSATHCHLSLSPTSRRTDVVGRESAGPILNGLPSRLPDIDPDETAEWIASLDAAIDG